MVFERLYLADIQTVRKFITKEANTPEVEDQNER